MPSIYNENSCWGVKRTYFRPDVFQNEFDEDFQNVKSTEVLPAPMMNGNVAPSSETQIKPICFGVSSNGYYGYQPLNQISNVNPQQIGEDNDFAMDIEDNFKRNDSLNKPSCSFDGNFDPYQTKQNISNFDRKRHINEEEFGCNTKRLKQSEPDAVVMTSKASTPQEIHQRGGGCQRKKRVEKSPNGRGVQVLLDSEMNQILRHTHGCELYLYQRTCDY